jgi:hypothetical protein
MPSKQIFLYKRPLIALPLAILLASILSCCLSTFITLFYVGWIEPFWKIDIRPVTVFLVGMIGLFAWLLVSSLKGWFWLLSLEDDLISLKTFWGKTITLKRNDIQKLEWQKHNLILSTVSEQLEFNTNWFPLKSKIELLNILPKWLPLRSLPPEWQAHIKAVETLVAEQPPVLRDPVQASTSLKHIMRDEGHVVVTGIIALFTISVVYGVLVILGFGIVSVIIILTSLGVAGAAFWSILNKQLEVSNQGIRYQIGFRKKFFRWGDIEAIAIRPYQGQMMIWVNGRYSSISLIGLHPQQLALFEQSFSQQVYARKVPFGYN